MKIVTVVSAVGHRYYFEVEDAVADSINSGQEDIEFDTSSGCSVGLNRNNFLYLAIGDDRYMGYEVGNN